VILLQLEITRHAKEKMIVHGLTLDDVGRAITQGSKTRQTDGLLACYAYYCVAYRVVGKNTYKIKTVYVR